MAAYTRVNLKSDVQDMAPRHGLDGIESRFARRDLGLEKSGMSYFRLDPGYRPPFGHRHAEQEEIYLVVAGGARIKIDDDVVELSEWDAIRVPGDAWRCLEGGPDGAQIVAFGAPNTDNKDIEMKQGWWSD